MAPTEGMVAKAERRWGCRRGTPKVPRTPPHKNDLLGIKWSRDRLRHVKGHTRDLNTLRAQCLENGWR